MFKVFFLQRAEPKEDLDSNNNNSSYSGNKREEPSVDATKPAEDLDSNNNNSSYSGNKVGLSQIYSLARTHFLDIA